MFKSFFCEIPRYVRLYTIKQASENEIKCNYNDYCKRIPAMITNDIAKAAQQNELFCLANLGQKKKLLLATL